LIAVDGPTPHGFVALVPGSSPQGNDVVLLSTLLVRASARGRGVGRALCAAAGVTAARLGIAALHLYTVDAGSYFRHLGWRFLSHAILGPAHRPYGASFMWIETAKRGEPCP
jgi:N-acetylglutamate synthase-like GNAT family acetyltransferase